MGKGRPFSTSTQFKMIIHTNGNHRYASTKPYTIGKDGIKRYTYKHWGTLDEQNRFIPGMAYMYASIEERQQLIFPKDWDLSQIEILSGTKRRGRIAYEAEDVDRQFGPTWLLNQVAVKIGLLDIQHAVDEQAEAAQAMMETGEPVSDRDEIKKRFNMLFIKFEANNRIASFEVNREKQDVTNDNSGTSGGINYQIEVFTETPANTNLETAWLSLYQIIYRTNLILQNVEKVQMSETQKNNIVGQASFLRGLAYFNLVRLWGNVPLITETQTVEEARENTRSDKAKVYDQIITDLTNAKKLPTTWPDAERGRATSFAARALLAKVYLYRTEDGMFLR